MCDTIQQNYSCLVLLESGTFKLVAHWELLGLFLVLLIWHLLGVLTSRVNCVLVSRIAACVCSIFSIF